ncbi:MAG: glutamate 5-kinase [Actinobacteria bacterium]|nr:glutamate 5-kinase [Actinomycetota bacterium]
MSKKTIVIKIGSNILTRTGYGINASIITKIVKIIAELVEEGYKPIIVSSGAIASGLQLLGLKRRPRDLATLQAAASVGQSRLVESYGVRFRKFGINVGQVLLTRNDFLNRESYLNAKKTIERLLEIGVVPIINENDAVAVEEIKFGDNDTLAALVSAAISADYLFLLTNVDGLMLDPRSKETLIPDVKEINSKLFEIIKPEKSTYGSGGMLTKVRAAQIATCAGVKTAIINGFKPERIVDFLHKGSGRGTIFHPKKLVRGKKHWIAFVLEPKGSIVIDEGAKKAIIEKKKSLLPAGVIAVEGDFEAGDAVLVRTESGEEIAKGIAEFSSEEARLIARKSSSEVRKLLGEDVPDEIIHRDKMVVTYDLLKGGKNDEC